MPMEKWVEQFLTTRLNSLVETLITAQLEPSRCSSDSFWIVGKVGRGVQK